MLRCVHFHGNKTNTLLSQDPHIREVPGRLLLYHWLPRSSQDSGVHNRYLSASQKTDPKAWKGRWLSTSQNQCPFPLSYSPQVLPSSLHLWVRYLAPYCRNWKPNVPLLLVTAFSVTKSSSPMRTVTLQMSSNWGAKHATDFLDLNSLSSLGIVGPPRLNTDLVSSLASTEEVVDLQSNCLT